MAARGLVLASAVSACALLVAGCSATTATGPTSMTPTMSPSPSGTRGDGGADRAAGPPDPSGVVAAACPQAATLPGRLADVVAAPPASWATVCVVSGSGRPEQTTFVGDPLHDAIRTAGSPYNHPCALVLRSTTTWVVLAYVDGAQRVLRLDDCGIVIGSDRAAFLSPQGRSAVSRVLAPVTGTRAVLAGMSLSSPSGWTVAQPRVCSPAGDRSVTVWTRWPVMAACPAIPVGSPGAAHPPVPSASLQPFTAADVPPRPWRARTTWNGQLAYLSRSRTTSAGGGSVVRTTVLAVPSLDAVLVLDGVDAATTADLLDRAGMVWPGGVRPAGLATSVTPSPSVSSPAAPTAIPS